MDWITCYLTLSVLGAMFGVKHAAEIRTGTGWHFVEPWLAMPAAAVIGFIVWPVFCVAWVISEVGE
jgi:hypothetical protein